MRKIDEDKRRFQSSALHLQRYKFDPWKSLIAINDLGNVPKDKMKDVQRIADENNLNEDHIILFFLLARQRTKINYAKNETGQEEVNRLFELKNHFRAPVINERTPMRKVNIDLGGGKKIEITNDTLLWNLYNHIYPSLSLFLDGYVKNNYRQTTKRQGLSTGLIKSNKNLARNIFRYLRQEAPGLKASKMGEIVIDLFELADNNLPYQTGKRCFQQLGTEK